jgi:hypothetical protein
MLTDSLDTAKLVGGYGLLFSGIFIVSLVSYAYLLIRTRKTSDKRILKWVHVSVVLILVSCLLMPIPNYARYNGQLYLLPIVMIVALYLVSYKGRLASKVLSYGLLLCLLLNFYIDAVPAVSLQETLFDSINTQLKTIEHAHKAYKVYSGVFYPSYLELRSHNINIEVSNHPLSCRNEINLKFPPLTQMCPIN